jgi:hypothetical protein
MTVGVSGASGLRVRAGVPVVLVLGCGNGVSFVSVLSEPLEAGFWEEGGGIFCGWGVAVAVGVGAGVGKMSGLGRGGVLIVGRGHAPQS